MVYVEQLYTGCLAEAAYIVVSNGEAAIVDPLRDPKPYMALAEKHNAKIKYILETHFHADFVSGHVDLAKEVGGGAQIVYGPSAEPEFDALVARDGEDLVLGGSKLKVLHTPGHTMESCCYLLINEEGKEQCVFTGDTVFIGDVGRPDLAQKAADMTSEQLAALLYQSIRTKIMPLADHLTIWPGHGAGSSCGKNMSSETSDTLGNQKATNYALRADMTEAEFVKEVLEGQGAAPGYFGTNVGMNKGINEAYSKIYERAMTPIKVADFAELPGKMLVIDSRVAADFGECYIPNTQSVGVGGAIAVWAGKVFPDVRQKFAIVAATDKVHETIERLARIGFDNCVGHLEGGIEAWKAAGKPVASIKTITADELAAVIKADPTIQLTDVRGAGEWNNSHLPNSNHRALCGGASSDITSSDASKLCYCYCGIGYRSLIYITHMKRLGYKGEFVNIEYGYWGMSQCAALMETAIARE